MCSSDLRIGGHWLLGQVEMPLVEALQVAGRLGHGPGLVGVDADPPRRPDGLPDQTDRLGLALDVDPVELPKSETRLLASGIPQESLLVRRCNFAGLAGLLASEGLPPAAKKSFLKQRVGDLVAFPGEMLRRDWARELPMEKQFELAAATILFARKPGGRSDPDARAHFTKGHVTS